MALLPTPTVDYTSYDFDAIRTRLYDLISGAFPEWTEQSVASFGNILVELFAYVGDVLGFYLDARARETRLSTATQRASIVALARLLGYVPEGATAARVDAIATLGRVMDQPVVIAKRTRVKTLDAQNPAEFQVLEAVTIPAGETQAVVSLEHSETHVDTFRGTGRVYQELILQSAPFIDRVIDSNGVTGPGEYVVADNGLYTRAESLLDVTSEDRVYTLFIDEAERAHLRFGDGTQGQLPSGVITVTYKTGGGPDGNVDKETITRSDSSFTDAAGTNVQVTFTNPLAASGGRARQSRFDIQREAPRRLRALTRTVSREDFETNALRVPGVKRALMLTSNEVASVGENRGRLYIVPAGGGRPSTSIKQAVHTMVTKTYPSTISFQLDVLDPSYLTVNIHAVVFLKRGASAAVVDRKIRENLVRFFSLTLDEGTDEERDNPDIGFGYYLSETSEGKYGGAFALSDIVNVVRDTDGVKRIGDGINDFLVNNQRSDLKILAHQFPRLGTVSLFNGETLSKLA